MRRGCGKGIGRMRGLVDWRMARGAGWNALCLALLTVILLVGGCRSNPSTVPTSTRVGVVDPQRILGETNAGKRAKDMLASFAKNRQALIELEEKELRRMEEDFVKQGSVLSATAKREREEQFRRRMAEYQQKVTDLNRGRGGPTLYFDEAVDVSSQLIEEFNKTYP
ncbi:MAG: OmpH family outer membrane protein [Nitrospira sp. NTP1]|nr:OmpH family outer membrane protein [Nitrospira sp. NTP1]